MRLLKVTDEQYKLILAALLTQNAFDPRCNSLWSQLMVQEVTFSDVAEVLWDPKLKHYADAVETSEGDLEVDDKAIVSVSDDGGAYVQCWKWVTNEQAGVETCDECGAQLDEAGDGYDGLCAECADLL